MRRNDVQVQQAINLFSRVLAVLLMVVSPGIVGLTLDRTFGFFLLAPIGFGIGATFGILGLWIYIKYLGQSQKFSKRPNMGLDPTETREDPRQDVDAEN